ncbi:hypothetical protein NIES2104_65100 [Leptolyngbya sp. NIES-2104]|nr:hypothetical protein NIES2104_65100 [Leptolyngbya sp. NIES-2104]
MSDLRSCHKGSKLFHTEQEIKPFQPSRLSLKGYKVNNQEILKILPRLGYSD